MKIILEVIPKMPKYKEIIREIINIIETSKMEQGDKLPSIELLMEQFEVGKNTILKALDELEKQAYIYQVRGSGSFVRKSKRSGYVNLTDSMGLKDNLSEFNIETKMIDLQIIKPNQEIMENLNVDKEDDIYYVKRLRSVEGKGYSIEESYYVKSVVLYLNQEIVEDSIFKYLLENLNIAPGFTDHFMTLETLNKIESDLLGLEEGSPVMLLESIFFLKDGMPFNYSKVLYQQDAQFFVQGYSYLDM